MIELPEPPYTEAIRKTDTDGEWTYSTDQDFANPEKYGWERVFTADQMRDYGLSCARAAMEMAAQIAEDTIVAEYEGVDCYGDRAAAAIRAEMSTPNTAKLDNMAAIGKESQ